MTGNSVGEHQRMAGLPLDSTPCVTKKVRLLLSSRLESISLEGTSVNHGVSTVIVFILINYTNALVNDFNYSTCLGVLIFTPTQKWKLNTDSII